MRRASSLKVQRGTQAGALVQLPAPTGGMNTRDHPSLLPPTESQWLYNSLPTSQGIIPRRAAVSHATGFASQPETLMVYVAANGTETLFAAAGTAFYNASAAGAIGAAVVSGLTNAKWNCINFTLSSGTPYLCCFNGVDSPRYWDGATWTAITGASTPAITGLTTTTIVSAFIHQRRMWLVQANSLKVWYLPIDSVGGAAQALDLGGVASKGGYVVAGSTWTIDAGDGVNDYWAVVTSEGQLIVYQGVDPSSASTWSLTGVWNIPEPLNTTCLYKYKNDLLIITKTGVLSTERVLNGQSGNYTYVTDKITPTYIAAVQFPLTSTLTNTRWFFAEIDRDDILLLCTQESDYCWAMNRSTGAWGQFALNLVCGVIFNGSFYWAQMNAGVADLQVYRYSNTRLTSGSVLSEFALSPSLLGAPGLSKKVTQIGLIGSTNGSPTTLAAWGLNYTYPSAVVSIGTFNSSNNLTTFLPLPGFGMAFTLVMQYTTNNNTFNFVGANVLFEVGGPNHPAT